LPGSQVASAGSIHLTPTDDGKSTVMHVELKYDPPGGTLGKWFAELMGEDPEEMIREDLRRFKRMMESGPSPSSATASESATTGSTPNRF